MIMDQDVPRRVAGTPAPSRAKEGASNVIGQWTLRCRRSLPAEAVQGAAARSFRVQRRKASRGPRILWRPARLYGLGHARFLAGAMVPEGCRPRRPARLLH